MEKNLEELKKFSTAELCRELETRGGVSPIFIDPYEEKKLKLEGPMLVFLVID